MKNGLTTGHSESLFSIDKALIPLASKLNVEQILPSEFPYSPARRMWLAKLVRVTSPTPTTLKKSTPSNIWLSPLENPNLLHLMALFEWAYLSTRN